MDNTALLSPAFMGEQLEAPPTPVPVDREPPAPFPAAADEKQQASPPSTQEDKKEEEEAESAPPPPRFPVLLAVSQWALTSACVFAVFGAYAFTLLTPCAAEPRTWWRWWCHELTGADAASARALLPRLAWRTATQASAAALAVLIPGRRRRRWLHAFVAYWATATNLYRFGLLVGLIYAGTNGDLVGAVFAVAGGLYLFVSTAMAFMSPGALVTEYQAECHGLDRSGTSIIGAMVKRRNPSLYYRLQGWYADMKSTDQPRSMVSGVACWALVTAAAFAVLAAYIVYLLTPCPSSSSSSSPWWWSCQELTGADADLARGLLPRLVRCSALQAAAAAMALALLVGRCYRSCRALALVALAATATNHCRLARLLGPVLDAWGEPLGAFVAGEYVFVFVPFFTVGSLIDLAFELVRGPPRWGRFSFLRGD